MSECYDKLWFVNARTADEAIIEAATEEWGWNKWFEENEEEIDFSAEETLENLGDFLDHESM